MNYKKISRSAFAVLLTSTLIFPSFVSATLEDQAALREARKTEIEAQKAENQAAREAKKEAIQIQRTEKTCAQLTNQVEKIQNQFAEKISQFSQKRTEMEAKIQQQIAARISEITQKRGAIDETKTLNWEKLRASAKTDEQKAAIEKFILAIQNAIEIKRAATEKILFDFRAELQTEKNKRETENNAALTTYKNTLATLVSQLKSDCADGKDAKTIRETFRAEIKNAREIFQTERKQAEKFRADISPLREAKKAELKAVIDTFRNSVEEAKTELRAVFAETAEITETE
jgi:DNA repair exonuclease SbcCD ATPase subunit